MTPSEMEGIGSRREMIRFFDGYSVGRRHELEERRSKKALVKSHRLEVLGATAGGLHGIFEPVGLRLRALDDALFEVRRPAGEIPSAAAYLVPASAMAAMAQTLSLLAPPLAPLGPAETGVLGLEAGDTAILLIASDTLADRLNIASATAFITLEPDTDPRPLYLIPYDPDCHQSPQEQKFCRRVLFERIHAAVLSRVGRLIAPATARFTVDALLSEATFGMFERWDSPGTTKSVRRLSRDLVHRIAGAVNGSRATAFAETSAGEWTVTAPDTEAHATLVADLARFSCETMDLRAEPSPGLFD